MQFINTADHGRELQFAITNASGECYNPTEAGSLNDGAGSYTSSRLLGVNTAGNIYRTTSLPAFWLAPGQRDVSGCVAKNPTIVSNFQSSKQLTIGAWGVPNGNKPLTFPHTFPPLPIAQLCFFLETAAIQYLLSTTVGSSQSYLQWEAPTGYMPENFNQFWTLNLTTGALLLINAGPGETPEPVIIATPDQNYAMGAFLGTFPPPLSTRQPTVRFGNRDSFNSQFRHPLHMHTMRDSIFPPRAQASGVLCGGTGPTFQQGRSMGSRLPSALALSHR